MRKWLVMLFLLSAGIQYIFGQAPVSGTVKDSKTGNPLMGASIRIKGKRSGTASDANGNFTLSVKTGDVLLISNVGFKPVEFTVGNGIIAIQMEPSMEELGQLVYVGSRGAAR